MKTVKVFEFKDLDMDIKKAVQLEEINATVDIDLDFLARDLGSKRITEREYYDILGCTKYFAESTGRVVPESYYNNNKHDVLSRSIVPLKTYVFDKNGKILDL